MNNSNKLLICRYKNGVKLIEPSLIQKQSLNNPPYLYNTGYSLGKIMEWPISFYFLNKNFEAQIINQQTLVQCNIDSEKEALGKSIAKFATITSAKKAIDNSREVMQEECTFIFNEEITSKNNKSLKSIAIKTPWYDDKDKLIGIFGCSIDLQIQPIAQALNSISQLGLLDARKWYLPSSIPSLALTQREKECLELTLNGKSAKQCAKDLGLSHRTIENYLSNIKSKLNVTTKSELMAAFLHY